MAANSGPVAITGIGMASSLGGAVAGIAAARAGILRSAALDLEVFDPSANELVPVKGHAVPTARGFEGVGRWCSLLGSALRDLEASEGDVRGGSVTLVLPDGCLLQTQAPEPSDDGAAAVPPAEVLRAIEGERRARALARVVPFVAGIVGVAPAAVEVLWGGRAGAIAAFARAAKMPPSPRLVLCVDSLLDPAVLAALAGLGLLSGPEQPAGVAPGEAAVAIRIEPGATARDRAARPVLLAGANTSDAARGRLDQQPPDGRGLAGVVAAAMACVEPGRPPVTRCVGSLNGDIWQSVEWGTAVVLCPSAVRSLPLWSPAEAFGETGACTAALGIACAATALQRGYASGSSLVWASGDEGQRGAILVGVDG